LYFGLQNILRFHLVAQYHKTRAYYDRSGRAAGLIRQLPPSLAKCFDSLVDRNIATLLWHSKQRFSITDSVRVELQFLHDYILDTANSWEVPIGHVVPRSPTFTSAGDASQLGGGAICGTS
jgi:hypothetical protein